MCLRRRNLNYFSSAYTAAVSAVDPDAGHGELVIKVPSELWKQGDGKTVAKKGYQKLDRHTGLFNYLLMYNAEHSLCFKTSSTVQKMS